MSTSVTEEEVVESEANMKMILLAPCSKSLETLNRLQELAREMRSVHNVSCAKLKEIGFDRFVEEVNKNPNTIETMKNFLETLIKCCDANWQFSSQAIDTNSSSMTIKPKIFLASYMIHLYPVETFPHVDPTIYPLFEIATKICQQYDSIAEFMENVLVLSDIQHVDHNAIQVVRLYYYVCMN